MRKFLITFFSFFMVLSLCGGTAFLLKDFLTPQIEQPEETPSETPDDGDLDQGITGDYLNEYKFSIVTRAFTGYNTYSTSTFNGTSVADNVGDFNITWWYKKNEQKEMTATLNASRAGTTIIKGFYGSGSGIKNLNNASYFYMNFDGDLWIPRPRYAKLEINNANIATTYNGNSWYCFGLGGSDLSVNKTYYLYDNKYSTIEPSDSAVTTKIITTYYVYYRAGYRITYNANGGSFSGISTTATSTYYAGMNATLTNSTPTREGYKFLGWATTSNAVKATYASGATLTASSSGFRANADMTLYAVWQPAKISSIEFKVKAAGESTYQTYNSDDIASVNIGGNVYTSSSAFNGVVITDKIKVEVTPKIGMKYVRTYRTTYGATTSSTSESIANETASLGTVGFDVGLGTIKLTFYFDELELYLRFFNDGASFDSTPNRQLGIKINSGNIQLYSLGDKALNDNFGSVAPHKYGYTWNFYYGSASAGTLIFSYEDVEDDYKNIDVYEKNLVLTRRILIDKGLTNNNIEKQGNYDSYILDLTMSRVENSYDVTFIDKSNTIENVDVFSANTAGGEAFVKDTDEKRIQIGNDTNSVAANVFSTITQKPEAGYYLKYFSVNGDDKVLYGENVTYDNDVLREFYKTLAVSALQHKTSEISVSREFNVNNLFAVAQFKLEGDVNVEGASNLLSVKSANGHGGSVSSNFADTNAVYCKGEITLDATKVKTNAGIVFLGWFLIDNNSEKLLSNELTHSFIYSPSELTCGEEENFGYFGSALATRTIVAKFQSTLGGSEADVVKGVYTVSSSDDLLWLAEQVDQGNSFEGYLIRQTADIDLAGVNFVPIGANELRPFKGVFDGNNYIIKNMTINNFETTVSNVGLFGNTDGATIKNLTLVGGSMSGYSNVGAVVGNAKNTTFQNVNNFSCQVNASELKFYDIYGNLMTEDFEVGTQQNFGGLVGLAENCSFVGCSNRATIVTAEDCINVAGLVGLANGGSIDQCYTEDGVLANGDVQKTNYYDSTETIKDNEEVWTTVNGKEVLKIFYWL